jgi:hypothetical protein
MRMHEIRDAASNDFFSPFATGSAPTAGGRTERYLGRIKVQMLTLALKTQEHLEISKQETWRVFTMGCSSTHRKEKLTASYTQS